MIKLVCQNSKILSIYIKFLKVNFFIRIFFKRYYDHNNNNDNNYSRNNINNSYTLGVQSPRNLTESDLTEIFIKWILIQPTTDNQLYRLPRLTK